MFVLISGMTKQEVVKRMTDLKAKSCAIFEKVGVAYEAVIEVDKDTFAKLEKERAAKEEEAQKIREERIKAAKAKEKALKEAAKNKRESDK